MRKITAALVCLFVGCIAGSTVPALTAQPVPANPAAERWNQYCEAMEFRAMDTPAAITRKISELVQRRGAEGWEMVFVTNGGVCFKRPFDR